MKRILFICNTYYQIIVAIQMQLTVMADADTYMLVTDMSKGAEQVYERLIKTDLFTKVFFQRVKEPKGERPSLCERIYYVYGGVFGNRVYELEKNTVFDEIIAFNFDLHSHIVYAVQKKKNRNLTCNKMEEGLLSYETKDDTSGVLSTIYKVRKFLNQDNMRDLIKVFYCFNPTAYSGELRPVVIPRITSSDMKLKGILEEIFQTADASNQFKQKYIYLPCIYDIEGGEPIGELTLAKEIAKIVGNDNLIVKVHPRDDILKYKNAGLSVVDNSSAPWEAIQISGDFSEKILLSTLSGSFLTMNALLSSPPRSYYLFPLCNIQANPLALHYSSVVKKYLLSGEQIGLKNICVCYWIDQILIDNNNCNY